MLHLIYVEAGPSQHYHITIFLVIQSWGQPFLAEADNVRIRPPKHTLRPHPKLEKLNLLIHQGRFTHGFTEETPTC